MIRVEKKKINSLNNSFFLVIYSNPEIRKMVCRELQFYRQQKKSSKWLMLIELRQLIERKKQEGQLSSFEEITKLVNMETQIIDSMRKGGTDYFFGEDYSLFTEAEKLL